MLGISAISWFLIITGSGGVLGDLLYLPLEYGFFLTSLRKLLTWLCHWAILFAVESEMVTASLSRSCCRPLLTLGVSSQTADGWQLCSSLARNLSVWKLRQTVLVFSHFSGKKCITNAGGAVSDIPRSAAHRRHRSQPVCISDRNGLFLRLAVKTASLCGCCRPPWLHTSDGSLLFLGRLFWVHLINPASNVRLSARPQKVF